MSRIAIFTLILTFHLCAHAAGDIQAGKAIFTKRCASCHSIGPSARGAFGPHLNSVIGRPAGASTDFSYSPTMKQSRIVWSEENLRAFLVSPGKVVPDTSMRFWGMSSEQQIEDLLAYLRSAK